MTVSRDKGSMKQRNLIAVWTSDNLTRDKNGKVNGAWIDVQFDQHEFCPDDQDGSKLAVSAVRKGYLKAVPSINVEYDG